MTEFVLDCSACPRRTEDHCDDCLVGFILDPPEGAVVFNADEERALRSLGGAGLLPKARLRLIS